MFSLVSFFPTGRMSFLSNTVHNFSMSFVYAIFKQTKLYTMSLQHQNKLRYIQCALYLCSVHTNKKDIQCPNHNIKLCYVVICIICFLFFFECLFVHKTVFHLQWGLALHLMNYVPNPLPILTNLTALLDLKLTKLMTLPREGQTLWICAQYVLCTVCDACAIF